MLNKQTFHSIEKSNLYKKNIGLYYNLIIFFKKDDFT